MIFLHCITTLACGHLYTPFMKARRRAPFHLFLRIMRRRKCGACVCRMPERAASFASLFRMPVEDLRLYAGREAAGAGVI